MTDRDCFGGDKELAAAYAEHDRRESKRGWLLSAYGLCQRCRAPYLWKLRLIGSPGEWWCPACRQGSGYD